jgi:hypothetical protein
MSWFLSLFLSAGCPILSRFLRKGGDFDFHAHGLMPQDKKPRAGSPPTAGTGRRARFSYDDLPQLFSFITFQADHKDTQQNKIDFPSCDFVSLVVHELKDASSHLRL